MMGKVKIFLVVVGRHPPERQNQYDVCMYIHIYVYIYKKIYDKELAHTIMEADNSQNL